ncbi:MAG: hypothetical protein NTX44_09735 [Ignavibacteriales bacterium]|nr:hypothetical protein [Ignavibacteriales bacterium]
MNTYSTKLKVLKLSFIILLCLLIMCCEKEDRGTPTSSVIASQKDTSQNAEKQPLLKPIPMRAYCEDGRYLVFRNYWQSQNLFRPLNGKYIGVMYDDNMNRNQNYYNQYGCRMIHTRNPASISQLHSYGYSLDSIIVSLHPDGWQQTIDSAVSHGVKRFYIDEPIYNSLQWLVLASAPYIASRGGTLTITESDFHDCDWYLYGDKGDIGAMVDLALATTPSPFVCCHTRFERGGGHYCHYIDPRDQWSYIMSRVPNLFKMVIINTSQSTDDMAALFGHANNLGINQVLLFPYQTDGSTYAGVESAIWDGWYAYWSQQFAKEVLQQWCCFTIDYQPSECGLKSWHYTGNTQWQ